MPPSRLIDLCTRLARFKKENKELLTYLLFESHDEQAYIQSVKADVDLNFDDIRLGGNLYLIKKSLRKILRNVNKYIRFAGSKQVEVELLIHFLTKLKESGIKYEKSTVLKNLYQMQLKKIDKALEGLHEDLQYDYRVSVDLLR